MKVNLEYYLEVIKHDVTLLREFKELLVKQQQFEAASNIRNLEVELYPITPEDEKLKNEAEVLKTVFAMADLNVSEYHAFIINCVTKLYSEKGTEIDLSRMSKIKEQAEKLYR